MISSVSIKNFKGFQNFHIKGLAPITLIGGKNNVGKSSFLEALFLLYSAYAPQAFGQQFSLRGAGNLYHNTIENWAVMFYNGDVDKPMEIGAQTDDGHYQLTYTIDKLGHAPDISIPPEIMSQVGPLQNANAPAGVLKSSFAKDGNTLCEIAMYANGMARTSKKANGEELPKATIILTGNVRNFNAQVLTELDINNRMDMVLDALRIIEPSIKGISVVPVENRRTMIINGVPNVQVTTDAEVYVDVGLARKMPLKLMGDGIGHLVNFIIAIVNSRNGIVLIDEIENGIHYSLRKDLWEKLINIAKQFKCQLIATTHSYGCLQSAVEAIGEEEKEDFYYIRLDEDKNRLIHGVTYTAEELRFALQMNMEVR